MKEIFMLAGAILGSVGSAALLIFCLSSWLGKVWANRILEKDKLKYQSELDIIRTQLQSESLKQNLMFSMYFQGQFKLYNDLWVSLSELQGGVDALWSEANAKNLKSFVVAVRRAKRQIRESALLVEPEHYADIMNVIEAFEQYRCGKEELIFARKDLTNIDDWEIREIINHNRENRERITAFVNLMLVKMRTQIGGAINNQITSR
jgi:hypothetical protein